MYRCSIINNTKLTPEDEPTLNGNKDVCKEVLLRLYGPSYSEVDIQLEVFKKLADQNLGPKLYAQFNTGRLEEYLPSTPLSWNQMTDDNVSAVIAKKIACIHKLDLSICLSKNSNWLLDQYRECYKFISEIKKNLETTTTSSSSLFNNCSESTKILALKLLSQVDFAYEIEFMRGILENCTGQLVFSHNDLHQNNILIMSDSGDKRTANDQWSHDITNDEKIYNSNYINEEVSNDKIVLIDFEFCSYNYRAFDLANHLSEWCFNYTGEKYPYFDFSIERFPSEEKQRVFLKYYASQVILDREFDRGLGNGLNENYDNNKIDQWPAYLNNENNTLENNIDILYEELQPLHMACNLLWFLWAVKSACTSEIEFGYWVSVYYTI